MGNEQNSSLSFLQEYCERDTWYLAIGQYILVITAEYSLVFPLKNSVSNASWNLHHRGTSWLN